MFRTATARTAILADVLASVRAGVLGTDALLDILSAVASREDSYHVWYVQYCRECDSHFFFTITVNVLSSYSLVFCLILQFHTRFTPSLFLFLRSFSLPILTRSRVRSRRVDISSTAIELLASLRNYPDIRTQVATIVAGHAVALCERRGWRTDPDKLFSSPTDGATTAASQEQKEEAKAGDAHLDALLRGIVMSILEVTDEDVTAQEGTRRFVAFVDKDGFKVGDEKDDEGESATSTSANVLLKSECVKAASLLSPDARSAAYSSAAKTLGKDAFARLVRILKESTLSEEQDRASQALASIRDPETVEEVLKLVLKTFDKSAPEEEVLIRLQDVAFVIRAFRHADTAILRRVWTFVQENWDALIYPAFASTSGLRHVISVVSGFTTVEDAEQVTRFFAEHKHTGAEMFLQQVTERITAAAAWADRDHRLIHVWLQQQQQQQ